MKKRARERRSYSCTSSPVITAGVILGTLGDLAKRAHPDFKGVYDRTQMAEVLGGRVDVRTALDALMVRKQRAEAETG